MITETDLRAAIAECQGERNPNANTCMKLAAYYTILNNLYPAAASSSPESNAYSYDSEPSEAPEEKVGYLSGTDFGKAINGKSAAPAWAVVDELMTVLQAIKPNLYDGVMRKLREL